MESSVWLRSERWTRVSGVKKVDFMFYLCSLAKKAVSGGRRGQMGAILAIIGVIVYPFRTGFSTVPTLFKAAVELSLNDHFTTEKKILSIILVICLLVSRKPNSV